MINLTVHKLIKALLFQCMRKVAKGKLQRCERLVILLITIVIMLSNTPCKSRRKTFWFMRNAQSMTSSLTYNNVVCYSHSPSHTPAPTMLLCVLLCTHDVAYLPTYLPTYVPRGRPNLFPEKDRLLSNPPRHSFGALFLFVLLFISYLSLKRCR